MALDIFLTIPGVSGESQQKSFEGAIEVTSYNWGVTNPTTVGSASGGTGAGKVKFNDLNITKQFDQSSPKLFQACESGQHFPKVTLTLRKTAGNSDQSQTFLTYVFGDVFVTSITDAGSSGGDSAPTESISFVMGSIQVKYTPQNPDGSSGTPVTSGWDVTKNKAS